MISDPSSVAPGGQASIDMLQNARSVAADSIARGNVVKRVLGTLWVRPSDASSTTEAVGGIIMTEADAEAASAVADPAFDTLARWLWWKRMILGTQATGELGTGEYLRFELDLKMNARIFNRGDALNFILQNDDGTHSFTFALGMRLLIQK